MRKARKKEFDFKPLGQAIKNAREDEGLTREAVAEIVSLDPRYYAKIENSGQYPSLGVFYLLIKIFRISVDEYFMTGTTTEKSTRRKYIDSLLDRLSDQELRIIEGTIKGVLKYKENG